jgi:hypothetical protein
MQTEVNAMTGISRHATRRPVSRSTERRAPSAAVVEPLSAHDQLVAIKSSLETISEALNAIDPETLSNSEHAKWADEVNQVDLAIARVRSSLLNGIAEAFEAEMPSIRASTARLEKDLSRLRKAVDVINAIAGVLGVVEQIIRLGR